jgi:hypothetical protein
MVPGDHGIELVLIALLLADDEFRTISEDRMHSAAAAMVAIIHLAASIAELKSIIADFAMTGTLPTRPVADRLGALTFRRISA